MKKKALRLIKIYQKSPIFHFDFATLSFRKHSACRFTPTCSEYAYEAIEKYGLKKGSIMAGKRILKCHPFAKGGFDPVS